MPLYSSPIFAAVLVAVAAMPVVAHELQPAMAAAPRNGVELAARFDLRLNAARADWYLWRQAELIETANAQAGQGSIWRRVGEDGYHYRRVFHADRRIVDSTPGELRTRHAEPDWEKLGSVISPQLPGQLRRSGRATLFGQPATHYVGSVGGQQIDLWWLESARLPAKLAVRSVGRSMRLTLQALHAGPPGTWPAAWPRADEEKIADYGQLDAADFGDMENDPFVARVMQAEGHAH